MIIYIIYFLIQSSHHCVLFFVLAYIESRFVRGEERWVGVDTYGRPASVSYNGIDQNIGVQAVGREKVYFVAPGKVVLERCLSKIKSIAQ